MCSWQSFNSSGMERGICSVCYCDLENCHRSFKLAYIQETDTLVPLAAPHTILHSKHTGHLHHGPPWIKHGLKRVGERNLLASSLHTILQAHWLPTSRTSINSSASRLPGLGSACGSMARYGTNRLAHHLTCNHWHPTKGLQVHCYYWFLPRIYCTLAYQDICSWSRDHWLIITSASDRV
jgi:hypothetical protein